MISQDSYNYESFTQWYDSSLRPEALSGFINSPKVGNPAPDFEALTSDGYRVKLSELRGTSNVVLEFGCSTCPPFVNSVKYAAMSLEKLAHEYSARGFEFFIVYTREAHPGEKITQHKSYEEKMRRAKDLKNAEDFRIPILVDSIEGQINQAYGSRPNGVFVVNKLGTLVFKSQWTDTLQLKDVLDNVIEWENLISSGKDVYYSYSETQRVIDMDRWADLEIKRKILGRAGDKAIREWKETLKDSDPI